MSDEVFDVVPTEPAPAVEQRLRFAQMGRTAWRAESPWLMRMGQEWDLTG